jgi:hypothetical protein
MRPTPIRNVHLIVIDMPRMVRLLKANKVHSTGVPDQDGLRLLLKATAEHRFRASHLWVDASYQSTGICEVVLVARLNDTRG